MFIFVLFFFICLLLEAQSHGWYYYNNWYEYSPYHYHYKKKVVTKRTYIYGLNQHGWNWYKGKISINFSTSQYNHLNLSKAARESWSKLKLEEIYVLNKSMKCEKITSSTPTTSLIGACLTKDSMDYYKKLGINPHDYLTKEENMSNPILNSASISTGRTKDNKLVRGKIPSFNDVKNGKSSKAKPFRSKRVSKKNITLHRFDEISCHLKLKCFSNGEGSFRLKVWDAIPEIPYTLWAGFANSTWNSSDEGSAILGIAPFGGAPNIYVADKTGTLNVKRKIPYCPLDKKDPLMYVALSGHWDMSVYGATPDGNHFAGVSVGTQCAFNVAKRLN